MQVGHGRRRLSRAARPAWPVALLCLMPCMSIGFAQRNLVAVVENAKAAPVVITPLADGPGFALKNVSHRVVTHVQFACIAPGTADAKAARIRFKMKRRPTSLDANGPGSEQLFHGYRPEQSICSHQGSAITVLGVVFSGGKRWQLPHQIRDNDYIEANRGGESAIP